jgi:hypothetical protein
MDVYKFELTCVVSVEAPERMDARDLLYDVFSGEMQDFGINVSDLEIADGD